MAAEEKPSPWSGAIAELFGEQSGALIPSSAEPGKFIPDTDIDYQANAITEQALAVEADRQAIHKRDIAPPKNPEVETGLGLTRNAFNFLAGTEAAVLGITWDQQGISWKWDTAKKQITEHPYASGLALASTAGPLLAGAYRIAKATKAPIAAEELVSHGLLSNVDEYAKLGANEQRIVQRHAEKIADMTALQTRLANGSATPFDKVKAAFHESFGNKYLETYGKLEDAPQAVLDQWAQKADDLISGKGVTGMLDLADNVPKGEGTAILHAIKDPAQMKNLSSESKLFAMKFADESRKVQTQMLSEGFIDQETYDKVGDVWFSTLRKDSPLFEEGASTNRIALIKRKSAEAIETKGTTKLLNIPRTSTPHLKERKAGSAEVLALIKRQQAAEALEAGKSDKALKLLSDSEPEAAELIKGNRIDDAMKVLGREGFIETDPRQLVGKSLLQQKLVFENFRTLRDVALNPNLTKTADEFASMTKAQQRRFISLDRMENAATLRRMVATKSGKNYVDRLGYVDQNLFHQLTEVADDKKSWQAVDLLTAATAMFKTVKTAGNPYTHGQNVMGNGVLLHMAGMNPAAPENFKLLRQSWTSLRDFQKLRRDGKAIEEMSGLGKVSSFIKGNKDIDLAEELTNPLLTGQHGLLDVSSMEASEGLPVLARLYENAEDHQIFTKGLLKYAQKGAKLVRLDKAADAYMAEDSATKFGLYLHLRRNGLNPTAATLEVAKRMPMYNTVGEVTKRGRKVLYPWLSFPTEMTRIMKNNITDYPFRTAMWMHTPQLVQAGIALPQGRTYEEVEEAKKQAPMWGQKTTTVITGLRDKNDDVRAALMDFLPWSSVGPASIADEADWQEKIPANLAEPAPIIMGFVNALTGKGQFGEDIVTDPNSPTQKATSILLNMVGLFMPPVLQKYLANPTLPTPYYRGGQDLGFYADPKTGKTGDWKYDAILNSFAIKNYALSPDLQIKNQQYGNRKMEAYRGRLGRELSAWAKSGNEEEVYDTLQAAYSSFASQDPDNPGRAYQKYNDWVKMRTRDLQKLPAFRGLTKKEIIDMLTKAGDEAAGQMNIARDQLIQTLQQGAAGGGSGFGTQGFGQSFPSFGKGFK